MKIVDQQAQADYMYEARLIYSAAPALDVLLAKRKDLYFNMLLRSYREGKTDINFLAELSVIDNMQKEINNVVQNLKEK